MYTPAQLTNEVNEIILRAVRAETVIHPDWVAQEVAHNHSDHEGADADFWEVTGYVGIRKAVRACISQFKVNDCGRAGDSQLVLDGFEHLQRVYLHHVDDTQVGIPLKQATRAQMVAKAAELEANAEGNAAHAREVRRYIADCDATGDWPELRQQPSLA